MKSYFLSMLLGGLGGFEKAQGTLGGHRGLLGAAADLGDLEVTIGTAESLQRGAQSG